jgi:triosephosphate isomerase
MRRPLIAGNWKMNLNRTDAVALAQGIVTAAADAHCDVLVCPPTIYLDAVGSAVADSKVDLGAQDVYFEQNGAFTGETSTEMLKDIGCNHVILGHSERRNVIGETDSLINRKVRAAIDAGLTPVVCVGELLEQRESGQTLEVVKSQFEGSLKGISAEEMVNIVIAYEPVWAIGTGKTATPEQAQEVHADLRKILSERYNPEVADQVRILYGGSVKPANATDLMARPDIDGALVGGAALDADSFRAIIESASVSVTSNG